MPSTPFYFYYTYIICILQCNINTLNRKFTNIINIYNTNTSHFQDLYSATEILSIVKMFGIMVAELILCIIFLLQKISVRVVAFI